MPSCARPRVAECRACCSTFTRLSVRFQRVSVVTGTRGPVVAMVTDLLAASVAVRAAVNHFHLNSYVIDTHAHTHTYTHTQTHAHAQTSPLERRHVASNPIGRLSYRCRRGRCWSPVFEANSPQVTLVIKPAVDCHHFLPGRRLPSQLQSNTALGE